MIELYNTTHPYNNKVNMAYYSESGWVGFFLNFVLPQNPFEYLCLFEDAYGNHPFLLLNKISNLFIFNQLDFDEKAGFGSVDGAIYMESNRENYFIFINAINSKYKYASTIPEKSRLDFHKSINSRMELLYRFSIAIKKALLKVEPKVISENPDELHTCYMKNDKFYIIPGKQMDKKKIRRFKINHEKGKNFLGRFFKKDTRFYFLLVTDDEINPFSHSHPDFSEHYTPRLHPGKETEDLWEEHKKYFLWFPKSIITTIMKPELSGFGDFLKSKYCYYYNGIKDFSPEKIAFETREDDMMVNQYTFTRLDLWPL